MRGRSVRNMVWTLQLLKLKLKLIASIPYSLHIVRKFWLCRMIFSLAQSGKGDNIYISSIQYKRRLSLEIHLKLEHKCCQI